MNVWGQRIEFRAAGLEEDAFAIGRAQACRQPWREATLLVIGLNNVAAKPVLDGLPDVERQCLPGNACPLCSLHVVAHLHALCEQEIRRYAGVSCLLSECYLARWKNPSP